MPRHVGSAIASRSTLEAPDPTWPQALSVGKLASGSELLGHSDFWRHGLGEVDVDAQQFGRRLLGHHIRVSKVRDERSSLGPTTQIGLHPARARAIRRAHPL